MKQLPRALEPSLNTLDAIITTHVQMLGSDTQPKTSAAEVSRLFQLRLDLADRFENTPKEGVWAAWVQPAWAVGKSDLRQALQTLDVIREQYLERLANSEEDEEEEDFDSH